MAMTNSHPYPAAQLSDRLPGDSPAIAARRAQISHLASFDAVGNPHVPTVLLQGETGTGNGLVAYVIHDSGPRARGTFIEVNCAAIPDTMLEAELFGFEAGAFTDAKRAKAGLFEAASGGTLFLDGIDALPLVLQGKLLTAIETKRLRRLGGVTERTVDVKLIAATNADLSRHIATGRTCQIPPNASSRKLTYRWPWGRHWSLPRARRFQKWSRSMLGRGHCASRLARPPSASRR
jgi:transcriptional regulator with PAS, ATPase and Fis domain